MRIKHRVPTQAFEKSAEISEEYQREVDRATARLEKAYHQAQKRLLVAEHKAEKLQHSKKAKPHDIKVAWALVELRRLELNKYERMLMTSPQPAANRGTKSFRPIAL